MLWLVLTIGVLNLTIGFATAIHLGRRYRMLAAAVWPGLEPAPPWTPDSRSAGIGVSGSSASPPAAATASTALPPADTTAASPQAAPAATPAETTVAALQAEVSVYHERLSTTEARLRSEAGTADPAAISACLESLLAATAEYVRQQGPSQASLSAALSDDAVVQAECEAAIAALSHEQTQIQQARERLDSLDPRADVSAGHSALTGVAGKLFDANHRTRDALYGLQAGVQLSARGPEGLDDRLRLDALTGLLSRVGLEAALAEWWRKDPHRRRPLCLAMIDIDHFAAVNERWGQTGGNAVLQAIGEVLQNEQGGERVAARMLGQRFVVLMPDSDARSAVNWIERLRQAMETTRFVRRDEDLSLTVSCSVAQGIASDNPQSLMARAAAAVQQAKRYGRNRTFLSDGQFPTPVIPPNFPVETREIRI